MSAADLTFNVSRANVAYGARMYLAPPYRTAAAFCDPAVFQHPMQRPVERSGLERQIAFGELGDLLEDAVAVPLLGRQGQQNVELDRS